jgi:hypothetical protein
MPEDRKHRSTRKAFEGDPPLIHPADPYAEEALRELNRMRSNPPEWKRKILRQIDRLAQSPEMKALFQKHIRSAAQGFMEDRVNSDGKGMMEVFGPGSELALSQKCYFLGAFHDAFAEAERMAEIMEWDIDLGEEAVFRQPECGHLIAYHGCGTRCVERSEDQLPLAVLQRYVEEVGVALSGSEACLPTLTTENMGLIQHSGPKAKAGMANGTNSQLEEQCAKHLADSREAFAYAQKSTGPLNAAGPTLRPLAGVLEAIAKFPPSSRSEMSLTLSKALRMMGWKGFVNKSYETESASEIGDLNVKIERFGAIVRKWENRWKREAPRAATTDSLREKDEVLSYELGSEWGDLGEEAISIAWHLKGLATRCDHKEEEARATSDTANVAIHSGSKKKRGRPRDTDPKKDQQIAEAWQTGQHRTKADLATALNIPQHEVRLALDRHRKRHSSDS